MADEKPKTFLTKATVTGRVPREHHFETLGGVATLRPMKSGRQFEIEKSFPTNANGSIADMPGYMRAVVAETVCGEDGRPLFTADEIRDTVDTAAFWELWEACREFLGLSRKPSGKN